MTTDSPTLGLSMIVKNGAPTIERALAPFRAVTDEIVVADTGSEDETVGILEGLGARVVRFEWCDDYAAARNRALEENRADWILSIDADEYVAAGDAERIRSLCAADPPDAYVLETINFVSYDDGVSTRPVAAEHAAVAPFFFLSAKVRLWRRGAARWEGRVHELVDFSCARQGYEIARGPVRVLHDGLLSGRPGQRYLALARRAVEEGDAHAGLLVIVAIDEMKQGRLDEAERLIGRALAREPALPAPWAWRARLLRQTGRIDEAIDALMDGLKSTAVAPELLDLLIEIYAAERMSLEADTMRELAHKVHPGHPLLERWR